MTDTDRTRLLDRRAILGPAYRLFYDRPVDLVCGEGCRVQDGDGRSYLDAYNNVPVLGHAHPAPRAALARAAALINTHTRYLHEAVLDYAEALVATMPPPLDRAMFTCSGSEANDLALRIAFAATGGDGVVVTANAYHGVTHLLAGLSPSLGLATAPAVRTVAPPDVFRGGPAAPAQFAGAVAGAFADLAAHGHRPAALLLDTTLASDGIHVHPDNRFDGAVAVARAAGALFIADEVQGGFGRSGRLWTFSHAGLEPDLVTLGKPMGNGHPIGGVVARAALLDEFGKKSRYFNTFGGNTVSAAVGLSVLRTILEEDLPGHAARMGALLERRFAGLKAIPGVGDLRGQGLYRGIELVAADGSGDGARARRVVDALARDGILAGLCGPTSAVLKIRPPLAFGPAEVEELAEGLEKALRNQP